MSTGQSAPPLVTALVGPAGLAMDVVSRLFEAEGVVLCDDPTARRPDVLVLVEPLAEHWATLPARDVPVVLVTGERTADCDVVRAVLAGADAVLDCDTPPDAILAVLEEVGRGGSVLEPGQVRVVVGLARAAASRSGVVLSRREAEILASIAEGRAVKQTARDLGVAPKTVENLQGRLFRKLGARNRAQAVAQAHAMGLL